MAKKKSQKPNGTEGLEYPFEPWREKLRAVIVASGSTRRGLSLKAGLKEGYIRDIIAPAPGRKPSDPTISRLHKLVNALDLTVNDLFEESELNTRELLERRANRGFARVFSQISELNPTEQQWLLDGLFHDMEQLEKKPGKKPLKINPVRMRRIDEE